MHGKLVNNTGINQKHVGQAHIRTAYIRHCFCSYLLLFQAAGQIMTLHWKFPTSTKMSLMLTLLTVQGHKRFVHGPDAGCSVYPMDKMENVRGCPKIFFDSEVRAQLECKGWNGILQLNESSRMGLGNEGERGRVYFIPLQKRTLGAFYSYCKEKFSQLFSTTLKSLSRPK